MLEAECGPPKVVAWDVVGSEGEGLRKGSECSLLTGKEHRAEKLLQNRGRVCLCGKRVSVCILHILL